MTTQAHQRLCNRIREALIGDDGRCFRKCERCCGLGGGVFDVACPDCTDGRIENRERIAKACAIFSRWPSGLLACAGFPGAELESTPPVVTDSEVLPNDPAMANLRRKQFHDNIYTDRNTDDLSWLNRCIRGWGNRKDQPWCKSLEEYVEQFVEDAPDYRTEKGMVLLKTLLRQNERSYLTEWSYLDGFRAEVVNGFKTEIAEADTEHGALFAATVAAIGGSMPASATE